MYQHIFLLVLSVIFPIASVIFPDITRPLSDEGMVKLSPNVSDCSAISSIVTDIIIVALVVPAGKIVVIVVEV